VLVDLSRLLAPFVPHLADAIWSNLAAEVEPERVDSVHLCSFPLAQPGQREPAVESAVERARRTVALGRTARAASGLKTRQPLAAVRVKLPGSEGGALSTDPLIASELTGQILDELNAKALELVGDEAEMVERSLYPLLPVIGPRHGRVVGTVMAAARSGDWTLRPDGRVEVGGTILEPDEYQLNARARPGHEVAEEGGLLVALDTNLTPELEAEGLAREVAHRLQNLRKAAGYAISDRIEAAVIGDGAVLDRLAPHRTWLADEILATSLSIGSDELADADRQVEAEVDGARLRLAVRRTGGA
jgi:isoleucyl-tRNA synthetase